MQNFELTMDRKDTYRFTVDGTTYLHSGVRVDSRTGEFREYWSKDLPVSRALLECSFEQLHLPEFIFLCDFIDWNGVLFSTFFSADYDRGLDQGGNRQMTPNGNLRASIYSQPDLVGWSRPYSFLQYAESLRTTFEDSRISGCEFKFYNSEDEISASFEFAVDGQRSEPISAWLNSLIDEVKRIHDGAVERISNRTIGGQIIKQFDFPESLQTACAQYLLYFSEFLRDLGIGANTKLTQDAGHVLFSITPTDENEALNNIREALDVYLSLPSYPLSTGDACFELQRLEHEIDALKFKVRTQQRELRMAEREIKQQDALLFASHEILPTLTARRHERLTRQPLSERLENTDNTGNQLFKLTKIKKAEDYGIEIDLGELFKRIKKSFNRGG